MTTTAAPPRRPRRARAPDEPQALVDHLVELRRRILISLAAVAAATVAAFVIRDALLSFLAAPYCSLPVASELGDGDSCLLVVNGVLDGFSVTLRVSLYAGLLLSAPVWLWQLWGFLAPGLHRTERRYAIAFVASALGMFAAGTAVAYVTLGKALEFLLSVAGDEITPLLTVDRYLSFLLGMVVVFGLAFELPVVLVLLNRVGVVSAVRLRAWRRGATFLIFAFAAIATPSTDPVTMVALALPMVVFYEVAIVLASIHDKRAARRAAAAEQAFWLGTDDDRPTPFSTLA